MKNKSILYLLFALLFACPKVYGQTYYLKSGGVITNLVDWGDQTDGTGSNPASFTIANIVWNIHNNTSITLSSAWDLGSTSGSTVNVGDGATTMTLVANGANITLGGGSAEFNIVDKATIRVTGPATFPLGQMRPLTGSTFVFGNGSPFIPAFSGTNSNYKSLIVGATNSLAASVVCNTLTVDPTFTLFVNDKGLTVGNFAGAGMLAASSSSAGTATLIVNGDDSQLNMANGFGFLNQLTINMSTNGKELSLGPVTNTALGGITVHNGVFNLQSGALVLKGQDLRLENLTGNGFNNAGGRLGGSVFSDLQVINSVITGNTSFDGNLIFLKSLTLNSAGSTFNLITDIQLFDSLSVQAGTLVTNDNIKIKSSDDLKGRLSRVGGTINGNIRVETLLYAGATGWANIGGPGVTGATVSQWDTWSSGSPGDGLPMTCTGCQVDPSAFNPPWNSIYTWAEPTTTYVTASSSTPLTPGLGFWAYVGNGQSNTSNLTLLNNGPPVVGNYSVTVSNTSSAQTVSDQGYNLIANPYASPISWTKVRNNNTFMDPTIYVWNANTSSFATFNSSNQGSTNGLSDLLPLGQGFYVLLNSVGTQTITFTETDKLSGNTHVLKPSGNQNFVKLKIAGPYGESDETGFCFFQNATLQYDQGIDSKKMFGFSPGYVGTSHPYTKNTTISSKDVDGQHYAISTIPPLAQDVTIPILVTGMSNGSYTIFASEVKNLSTCLTLKDKLLGVSHDLKSGDYVFQMNDTTSTPRFELFMCKDEALTTSVINVKTLENSVFINQDVEGVFVKTAFEKNSTAQISAFNIVGQKLMNDVTVNGTETITHLPLNVHNQVVIVKVVSDQGAVTKKIIKH